MFIARPKAVVYDDSDQSVSHRPMPNATPGFERLSICSSGRRRVSIASALSTKRATSRMSFTAASPSWKSATPDTRASAVGRIARVEKNVREAAASIVRCLRKSCHTRMTTYRVGDGFSGRDRVAGIPVGYSGAGGGARARARRGQRRGQ